MKGIVLANGSGAQLCHRQCQNYDRTGLEAEYSFETGIQKTVAWYLECQAWMERITFGEYQAYYSKMYG